MALLENINAPQDIKQLSIAELEKLAVELRERIIDTVNRNGGHLASPLGVVELTLAMHYVFDFEQSKDQLVWDVGHQCYAHKLLTGRRDNFHTLRTKDGISGYPKRKESKYDSFGTGHSSTSISAAVGMALGRDLLNKDNHVLALIGDGALTGGMALEGLQHAGETGTNMIVVLNDNEMSIAPNTGALARAFNRIIMAEPYKRAKEDVSSVVKSIFGDRMTQTLHEIEKSVKGFITKGAFFQELDVNYIGPVDGHDLPLLIECFSRLKTMSGPILFHCRTEKGKGLKEAEENPAKYHGVKPQAISPIDEEGDGLPAKVDKQQKTGPTAMAFTDAFAEAMVEAAQADDRVIGITAAMPAGTGMAKLETIFPDRFFDVGICEQHAVTMAAGMAADGLRPVVAIYSTFLQRAYDQIVHDVCIQNLPVVFAIDRGGLVGEDSPTHTGTYDLSFLRPVPNITVIAPRDDVDLKLMLPWALKQNRPVAIRYPRGGAPTIGAAENRNIEQAQVLRDGADANFLVLGPCAQHCLDAAEQLQAQGLSVGVVDARFVKPLDAAMLDQLADRPIITLEENALQGGFGSAVMEYYETQGRLNEVQILRLGLPDEFTPHATREEQMHMLGFDAAGLAQSAIKLLANKMAASVK